MIAIKSETYRWISYSSPVGFVLNKDGKNLPGMITVDIENVEGSIDNEIDRLNNDYGVYDASTKKVTFGKWFDPVDRDEILLAVKTALSQP